MKCIAILLLCLGLCGCGYGNQPKIQSIISHINSCDDDIIDKEASLKYLNSLSQEDINSIEISRCDITKIYYCKQKDENGIFTFEIYGIGQKIGNMWQLGYTKQWIDISKNQILYDKNFNLVKKK